MRPEQLTQKVVNSGPFSHVAEATQYTVPRRDADTLQGQIFLFGTGKNSQRFLLFLQTSEVGKVYKQYTVKWAFKKMTGLTVHHFQSNKLVKQYKSLLMPFA